MSALDIAPPRAPNMEQEEPKSGFFSKLFKKEKSDDRLDVDLIKEKIGATDHDIDDIKKRIEEPLPAFSDTTPAEEPTQAPIGQPPADWTDSSTEHQETREEKPADATDDMAAKEDMGAEEEPEEPPEQPEEIVQPEESTSTKEWTEEPAEPADAADESSWTEPPQVHVTEEAGDWAAPPSETHTQPAEEPEGWDAPVDTTSTDSTNIQPESSHEAQTAAVSTDETKDALMETPPVDISEHFAEIEQSHKAVDKELAKLVAAKDQQLPQTQPSTDVPEGREFVLKDGTQLKNLKDLVAALERMDDETWQHHVSEDKNDFANWIHHVLEQEELAERIRNQTAKQQLARILEGHEKDIEQKIKNEEQQLQQFLKKSKKLAEAENVQKKIAELEEQLRAKKEQLLHDQESLEQQVQNKVDRLLQEKLEEERKHLQFAQEEAEKLKHEYEERLSTVDEHIEAERAKKLEEVHIKEQELADERERLQQLEQKLEEEQRSLGHQKHEAEALLHEAKKAESRLDEVDKERARLDEESSRLKQIQDELAQKENEIQSREVHTQEDRQVLNKLQQELTKQEAMLTKEQHEFAKMRAEFNQKEREFKRHEKTSLAKLEAEQKHLDERLKQAEESEARLEQKMQERRKISKYIAEAEQAVASHDTEPRAPPPEHIRSLQIYKYIDEARDALQERNIVEARELYNKVRSSFAQEKLTPAEKAVLYGTIRELYDDIHLASIKG